MSPTPQKILNTPPAGVSETIHSGVRFITFNSPETKNALTVELASEYQKAIDKIAQDAEARVVVLGANGNCCSAGGDFDFLQARHEDTPAGNRVAMRQFYDLYLSIRTLRVPIVAAVSGHAIGAGLALALAADLRVVANDAKLGLTFVGLGLHPGMGATYFTERAVGSQRAQWALLTGATFSGSEGAEWGMFLEGLAQNAVTDCAVTLANQIAMQSPNAVSATLATLRDKTHAPLESALWQEASGQAKCYGHHEFETGLKAIRDKKQPQF